MELPQDPILEIIENLSFEDTVNLKKSGQIDNITDIKLCEILSKKYLNKMMKEYSKSEYPTENIFSDIKLHDLISKFCFSSSLTEFGYDIELTSEQIYRMISILTIEQLEKMNDRLNRNSGSWY